MKIDWSIFFTVFLAVVVAGLLLNWLLEKKADEAWQGRRRIGFAPDLEPLPAPAACGASAA